MICLQAKKPKSLCLSIPTGVEPEKIQKNLEDPRDFREEFGLDSKDFLVGTACFMRSWKGVDDFLKAAEILKATPNLKWVIIGGGT